MAEIMHDVLWLTLAPYITIKVGKIITKSMEQKCFHERYGYHRRLLKHRKDR